jgi:Domain of unknown function (DUF4402)
VTITKLLRSTFSWQGAQALGLALILQIVALGAHATSTFHVQVTAADLGRVTSAASGDSVFQVDPTAGVVTEQTGTATRSGSGPARATVTITCTAQVAGDCTKNVNVKFAITGSPSGRQRALTRLTFQLGTATIGPGSGPGPPGQTFVTIAPVAPGASATIFIGGNMTIAGDDSGLATGVSETDFSVSTGETTSLTPVGTGAFLATIIRSLSISKVQDLVFGTVSPPQTGAGTVTIDPGTGARTLVGAAGFAIPTPAQATFNVTGEGGQAFSVSVPATFLMTGPQAMTVTTSRSITGAPALSGTLGSPGALNFGVGGVIAVNSTTPNGSYTGSFTVTVAYN